MARKNPGKAKKALDEYQKAWKAVQELGPNDWSQERRRRWVRCAEAWHKYLSEAQNDKAPSGEPGP